ncbi:MAG: hypothetical protein DMD79_08840, partial [Candidatus Rokuibacteriota bacterium]
MLGRFGLKTILVGGAMVGATLPAIVLGLGSARAVRDGVIAQATVRYQLLAEQLAQQYAEFLASHLRAVTTVAAQVAALEPLSLNQSTLGPVLARMRPAYPEFSAVVVVNASGQVVAAEPAITPEGRSTIGADVSDRAWFREMAGTRRGTVDRMVVTSGVRGVLVVSVYAPILDAQGTFRGAVAAGLDLEAIQAIADTVGLGRSGYAQVATAQGLALAHRDRRFVAEQQDFSRLPIWPLVTASATGQVPRYVGLAGDERIAGFATVPEVGWKIWVNQQRSEVEDEVRTATRGVLLLTALTLLGALGVAVVVAARIARPIEALTRAAEATAAGRETQAGPAGGPREVVALASAFGEMVKKETAARVALEGQLAETAALLEIARVVGGTTDLSEALRRICRELARLTGADTVAAYVAEPERGVFRPTAAYHVPKDLLAALTTATVPLAEQDAHARLFTEGKVIWSDDVPHDPRLVSSMFRRFPHQSGLLIPLVLDGRVSGTFYLVWWTARRRFEPAALATLQAVGQQVGALLRSARLHEETRAREREATRLYQTTQRLTKSLNVEEIMDQIAEGALELLEADASGIYEHDAERQGLVFRRGLRLDPALTRDLVLAPGEGVAGRAYSERRPVWTADRAADRALDYAPASGALVETRAPRAYLAVPIVSRDAVHGVLVAYFFAPHAFAPREVQLLSTLADQAAIAIDNAGLYTRLERRLARLRALTRVNQLISSSLQLDQVLREIAKAAAELTGAAVASFWVVDETTQTLEIRAFSDEAMGADQVFRRARFGEGSAGWVAQHRVPMSADNAFTDGRVGGLDWWRRHGLRAVYTRPVIREGALLAVLSLNGTRPFRFDAEDEELID